MHRILGLLRGNSSLAVIEKNSLAIPEINNMLSRKCNSTARIEVVLMRCLPKINKAGLLFYIALDVRFWEIRLFEEVRLEVVG